MGKHGLRGNVGPKIKPSRRAERMPVLSQEPGFCPAAVPTVGDIQALTPRSG